MPSESDVVRVMMALHAQGKPWIRAKHVATRLNRDTSEIAYLFQRLSTAGRIESFDSDTPHAWRLTTLGRDTPSRGPA